MRILGVEVRRSKRAEERQTVTAASPDFMEVIGLSSMTSAASDVIVTTETALGVPAIWGAVNFIAGTIAGLPMNLYTREQDGGRKRDAESDLASILHDAVNDETSSFEWRKSLFENVLTGGRGFAFIERSATGKVMNLWPLVPRWVTVKRKDSKKTYEYREPGTPLKVYKANEIIDIPFMLKDDGVKHRGPIATNKDVIGLAIAVTQFGSKFFQNGGVPPFAVTGNFQSGRAMQVAADDLADATRKAAKDRRMALVLPAGLDVKPLGVDAEKSQLNETKQQLIEEIARIYSLPPTFIQDLTHGTFSNTEQQDLHLVKHTLKRWVEAFEQELNLKLFGRSDRNQFVELNMDGLLRGDFKTRMEGFASAIQHGIYKPGEVREMENRPRVEGDDSLYMQGAMLPIGKLSDGDTMKGTVDGA